MKKQIFVGLIVLILFSCFCTTLTAVAETAANNNLTNTTTAKQKPSETDSVIILLLNEPIQNAIREYYGGFKQAALYNAVVNNITQIGDDFAFEVTISVPTFEGPHNPPYGLEIMTFTVSPYGVELNNYVHKDLPN